MSQQRSGSTQYANSNINTVLSRSGSASAAQAQPPRYGPGLVSLGAPKRPRSTTVGPSGKLAVPRPVNLPSLKKENSGNDPNTQLVPTSSGARGSWKQPEEQPQPDVRTSALTAGSNWAGPGKSPGPYWQPPEGPYPTAATLPPRDRHLNPHEYPTLSAAAAPRPHFPRQPVPSVPPSGQGLSKWDEDERQVPAAPTARAAPPEWAREQEAGRGFAPSWEDARPGLPSQDWRSSLTDGPLNNSEFLPPRPPGRQNESADRWQPPGNHAGPGSGSSGYPPRPEQRAYSQGAGSRGGRFSAAEFPALPVDPQLFPPPPLSKDGPPTASFAESATSAPTPAVAAPDPEREAFEAELERVAADMERERLRKLEEKRAPPPPPPEPETEEKMDVPTPPIPLAQALSQGSGTSGQGTLSQGTREPEEDTAAALEAARARAVAMRAQREAAADEADRLRRGAAQAKLAELEQRIARRKAEEAAKAAAAEEQEALEKARLEQVVAAASAASLPGDASADSQPPPVLPSAASQPPSTAPHDLRLAHDSLDVNLSGSVARDLEALADATTGGPDVDVDVTVTALEAGLPGSPLGPPASAEVIEAAIEGIQQEGLADSAWDKPLGLAAALVPNGPLAGEAGAQGTTLEVLAPEAPEEPAQPPVQQGAGDWDTGSAEEPPEPPIVPSSLPASQEVRAPSQGPAAPAQARAPAAAIPQPPLPTTSWRRIVSGDTGTPLSPREAAVAAAQAAQEKPAPPELQMGPAKPGERRSRDGRERTRPPRDGREPAQGERGERLRGRGRERTRERRGGRDARRRDEQGVPGEEPAAKAAEGEEAPAGEQRRGSRGGQRGQGRQPREDGAAPGPRGRGRGKSLSPRGAAAPSAAVNPPQGVPTRIVKPPGLQASAPAADAPVPSAAAASASTPPGEAQAGMPNSLQSIAEVISDVPGISSQTPSQPPQPPQQPSFVWGNLTSAVQPTDAEIPGVPRGSILDPVAPTALKDAGMLGVPAGASSPAPPDRAVDRPKSAAGAVARPQRMLKAPGRSSYEQQRPELLKEALELPNGMPVLPADLTFDAPSSLGVGNAGLAAGSSEQDQQPPSMINFGIPPPVTFSPGNPLFSSAAWQSPALNTSQAAHSSPSTSLQAPMQHGLDAFLPGSGVGGFGGGFGGAAGGQSGGGSPLGNTGGNASLPSAPQFGAFRTPFGQGVQFGQLHSSYGQTPFVPTGKQPDWSTGPIPGAAGNQNSTAVFSSALDSAIPLPGFTNHNGPAAPRPPGLNRHPGAGPTANGDAQAVGPHPGALSGLGDRGAQMPPGLVPGHRGPVGPGASFHPAPPVDAAAALPDDVLGSEILRPGSAGNKAGGGRGVGANALGLQGRSRGVDPSRRGPRGRMDPSRGAGAPMPNPQAMRGMPPTPRGVPTSLGPRPVATPIAPPRPPALQGLGQPPPQLQMPPPLGPAPPGPESARGAREAPPSLGASHHGPRRGRGARGGSRGERRSGGAAQQNGLQQQAVKVFAGKEGGSSEQGGAAGGGSVAAVVPAANGTIR